VLVGRLQQRAWTAEDGSARSTVEVVAEEPSGGLRPADAPARRPAHDHVAPTYDCTTYGVMPPAKMQECASTARGRMASGMTVLMLLECRRTQNYALTDRLTLAATVGRELGNGVSHNGSRWLRGKDAFSLPFRSGTSATTRLPLTRRAPKSCVMLEHGRSV
jgi:hypothetical protein